MTTRKEIGYAGEDAACTYLQSRGFDIVARNYIAPHGEIDIIAQNEAYLVFCEVKTRKDTPALARYGRPGGAVTPEKRAHLLDAAKCYMKLQYGTDRPCGRYPRFDVAEVLYTEDEDGLHFRIHYIERAFGAGRGAREKTDDETV